ncbi:hypothetical protein ACS0TY_013605 [Phlomoides rotata]
MVSTVGSALIFEERRSLIQVFSDGFIEFFNDWEVRVFIILSLILQIILITLGNRRKYVCKVWIRITLWCAYLLADWVAIVSLGIISKNTIDKCKKPKNNTEDSLKNQLMWFWAQFFLLHLGGPDTITAYSLEDNELWLRHLVAMVIQTVVAFYVLLFSFQDSSFWLPVLGILIFIAGTIKYGERLCALYASHSENFRDSMLTEPDAGPNYAKFMEEYTLKKAEGFHVSAAEVIETPVPSEHAFPTNSGKPIVESYEMLLKFKRLFADAILSFQDRDSSQLYFKNLSADKAFDVVQVELGFMFDELYTKASIVYNVGGLISRLITFSFTLLALMAFVFLCDKRKYKKLDVIITYFLLVVAICLEIYAVCVLINSDWTSVWLSRQDGNRRTRSSQVVGWIQCWLDKKRWSKKMAQHNLLDLCVRDRSAVWLRRHSLIQSIRKIIPIDKHIEKHWYKTFVDVSPDLKEVIFEVLKGYMKNNEDPTSLGNGKRSSTLEKSKWINEREFDQRILVWHIATDICYSQENGDQEWMEISKQVSNYMLYLLVACPFMLPIGIGMMRFRDTCAEAKEFLQERNIKCERVACNELGKVNTEVRPIKVKGDRSKSVLFDAVKLVKDLSEEGGGARWEVISHVWVEMLAHAAKHCGGNHHARQLRKGGELLTHVWLLMAHLGITEQFQISHGHARAKLVVR